MSRSRHAIALCVWIGTFGMASKMRETKLIQNCQILSALTSCTLCNKLCLLMSDSSKTDRSQILVTPTLVIMIALLKKWQGQPLVLDIDLDPIHCSATSYWTIVVITFLFNSQFPLSTKAGISNLSEWILSAEQIVHPYCLRFSFGRW